MPIGGTSFFAIHQLIFDLIDRFCRWLWQRAEVHRSS